MEKARLRLIDDWLIFELVVGEVLLSVCWPDAEADLR